ELRGDGQSRFGGDFGPDHDVDPADDAVRDVEHGNRADLVAQLDRAGEPADLPVGLEGAGEDVGFRVPAPGYGRQFAAERLDVRVDAHGRASAPEAADAEAADEPASSRSMNRKVRSSAVSMTASPAA